MRTLPFMEACMCDGHRQKPAGRRRLLCSGTTRRGVVVGSPSKDYASAPPPPGRAASLSAHQRQQPMILYQLCQKSRSVSAERVRESRYWGPRAGLRRSTAGKPSSMDLLSGSHIKIVAMGKMHAGYERTPRKVARTGEEDPRGGAIVTFTGTPIAAA